MLCLTYVLIVGATDDNFAVCADGDLSFFLFLKEQINQWTILLSKELNLV